MSNNFTRELNQNYSNPYESPLIIKSCEFSNVIQRLREFFMSKGYVEVHTQNRLSILAACEDLRNPRIKEYKTYILYSLPYRQYHYEPRNCILKQIMLTKKLCILSLVRPYYQNFFEPF